MDSFNGPVFHTSMWRKGIDLTGKRVAVVGTGATSVQIIPEIAEQVKELHVFQRTAAWSPPKSLFDFSEKTKVRKRICNGIFKLQISFINMSLLNLFQPKYKT